MALQTLVKVGNITNLSDARYCAGMGADMLGFNFDQKSPDYINPDSYKEIVGWVSGPEFVGEFEQESPDVIEQVHAELKLNYVQVEDVLLANDLCSRVPVILKINLKEYQHEQSIVKEIESVDSKVKYLILESDDEISAELEEQILSLAQDVPLIKGFALDAESILDDRTLKYKGISLKGSQEEKPGFKDYDELADILEALEIDD